jgi:hypothetical protein
MPSTKTENEIYGSAAVAMMLMATANSVTLTIDRGTLHFLVNVDGTEKCLGRH